MMKRKYQLALIGALIGSALGLWTEHGHGQSNSWEVDESTDPMSDASWQTVFSTVDLSDNWAAVKIQCGTSGNLLVGFVLGYLNPDDRDWQGSLQTTYQRIRWNDAQPVRSKFYYDDDFLQWAGNGKGFVDNLINGNRLLLEVRNYGRGAEVFQWSLAGATTALSKLPCV